MRPRRGCAEAESARPGRVRAERRPRAAQEPPRRAELGNVAVRDPPRRTARRSDEPPRTHAPPHDPAAALRHRVPGTAVLRLRRTVPSRPRRGLPRPRARPGLPRNSTPDGLCGRRPALAAPARIRPRARWYTVGANAAERAGARGAAGELRDPASSALLCRRGENCGARPRPLGRGAALSLPLDQRASRVWRRDPRVDG